MPSVSILGDDTHVKTTLEVVRNSVIELNNDIDKSKNKLVTHMHQADRLLNLILGTMRDNAVAASILAAQTVAMGVVAINQVRLQAEAAFLSGNVITGGVLTATAALMGRAQVDAVKAMIEAKRNENYMKSLKIAEMRMR